MKPLYMLCWDRKPTSQGYGSSLANPLVDVLLLGILRREIGLFSRREKRRLAVGSGPHGQSNNLTGGVRMMSDWSNSTDCNTTFYNE
jgi:hypothetical protein